jgi:hypothetical protein
VFTATIVALAMTSGAPALPVQDPPAGAPPAVEMQQPEVRPLTPQQAAAAAQKRRNQIQLMEGLLARAGSIAAEDFGRQLKAIEPGMTVMIGQSRARGFVLDGYGIFFDVEVPELIGTVVWSQLTLQREMEVGNALQDLKRALQDMPDGPSRQEAQRAIRVLDLQAGPLQPQQANSVTQPATVAGTTSPDQAIKVSEGTITSSPPADSPDPPVTMMKDPRQAYRDTVQRELIDAMLDYSLPMDVGPGEWLAVAARVSEAGQRGQVLMMRVKGSDLAIYAADKGRRDEIRRKVEVRIF